MLTEAVEVLQLSKEGDHLVAHAERFNSNGANILLSWNATRRPHGFRQIGGGVAFVQCGEALGSRRYDSAPDNLGIDHYGWRDTAHDSLFTLIVLFPEGLGVNPTVLRPLPKGAKVFNGRLTVYWELRPDQEQVIWNLIPVGAAELERIVQVINQRGLDPEPPGLPEPKPSGSIGKWVSRVVTVLSAAATIYGLFTDKRIAIFAFICMVFAIVLLLIVQRAIREVVETKAGFYDVLVKVLIVFVLVYFMALAALLFPPLYRWLTAEPETSHAVTISPDSPAPAQPNKDLVEQLNRIGHALWGQNVEDMSENSKDEAIRRRTGEIETLLYGEDAAKQLQTTSLRDQIAKKILPDLFG